MKIECRKITNEPRQFTLKLDDEGVSVEIYGSIYKMSNGLIKIDSNLIGSIDLVCDISGDNFTKKLNEHIIIFANNGIYNSNNHINDDHFDVIEFFDGYVNLDSIFRGELESIKLEYHTKD